MPTLPPQTRLSVQSLITLAEDALETWESGRPCPYVANFVLCCHPQTVIDLAEELKTVRDERCKVQEKQARTIANMERQMQLVSETHARRVRNATGSEIPTNLPEALEHHVEAFLKGASDAPQGTQAAAVHDALVLLLGR